MWILQLIMIITLNFHTYVDSTLFFFIYNYVISFAWSIHKNKSMHLGIIIILRNISWTHYWFKFCVNYEPILNILAHLKWGSAFGTCARTHCAVMPMWDTQTQINHRADLAVACMDLKSKGPWAATRFFCPTSDSFYIASSLHFEWV